MKFSLIKSGWMIVMLFFLITSTQAQEADSSADGDEITISTVGLGLNVSQFRWSDIASDFVPTNQLIVPITLNNVVRIEPGVGWLSIRNTEEGTQQNDSDESTTKAFEGSIGIFGMVQKGKTNIYGGLRTGYGQATEEYETYDWEGNKFTMNSEATLLNIAPTVGVEYFFSPHFSFGGEFNLRFLMVDESFDDYDFDGGKYTRTQDYTIMSTNAGIQIRFYFN